MVGADTNLGRIIDTMREQAARFVSYMRGSGEYKAEDLSSEEAEAPKYFDREETRRFFDPDQARTTYVNAFRGEGDANAVKFLIVGKLQSDMLGTLEREYKARRSTRLNSLALEVSRRTRHAESDGPINRHYKGYIQRVLES